MREKAAYLPEMIIENFSPRGVFYDNEMSPPIVIHNQNVIFSTNDNYSELAKMQVQ